MGGGTCYNYWELGMVVGVDMDGVADDFTKSITEYGQVEVSDVTLATDEPRCTLGSIPNFFKRFVHSA